MEPTFESVQEVLKTLTPDQFIQYRLHLMYEVGTHSWNHLDGEGLKRLFTATPMQQYRALLKTLK